MSDANNYRPIALVTAASKILELVLLNYIESLIDTSHTQFGFKRKHATDLCIYFLKMLYNYNRQYNSPVFTCFLDASRAFDRVNYWTLFNKINTRRDTFTNRSLVMFLVQYSTILYYMGQVYIYVNFI